MCNKNNNVACERNRRRRDCDFVFECLLELLEDALEENDHHHCNNWCNCNACKCDRRKRDCDFVFECLEDLLEDALEDKHDHCKRY